MGVATRSARRGSDTFLFQQKKNKRRPRVFCLCHATSVWQRFCCEKTALNTFSETVACSLEASPDSLPQKYTSRAVTQVGGASEAAQAPPIKVTPPGHTRLVSSCRCLHGKIIIINGRIRAGTAGSIQTDQSIDLLPNLLTIKKNIKRRQDLSGTRKPASMESHA